MSYVTGSSGFPRDEIEAIAYLYVQSQDLTGKTPAEIYTLYQEAYWEVKKDNNQKSKSGWLMEKKGESRQV